VTLSKNMQHERQTSGIIRSSYSLITKLCRSSLSAEERYEACPGKKIKAAGNSRETVPNRTI
jgi:hypothetical protein